MMPMLYKLISLHVMIIHVIDSVLLPPGNEGPLGPDIGDDDEMMSMPRSKAAMEDWSQAEKEYFLQNFAL